jgi:hypothetical protein
MPLFDRASAIDASVIPERFNRAALAFGVSFPLRRAIVDEW